MRVVNGETFYTREEAAVEFEKNNLPGEQRHADAKLQSQDRGSKTHRGELPCVEELDAAAAAKAAAANQTPAV